MNNDLFNHAWESQRGFVFGSSDVALIGKEFMANQSFLLINMSIFHSIVGAFK